jgi:hypothetical protein
MKIPLLYFKIKDNISDYLSMLSMIDEFKQDDCKYKMNIREDDKDYIIEIIKDNTLENKLKHELYYILLDKHTINIQIIAKIRATQDKDQFNFLILNLVSKLKSQFSQYILNIKKSPIQNEDDCTVYIVLELNPHELVEDRTTRILDRLIIYNNSAYNKILNRYLTQ